MEHIGDLAAYYEREAAARARTGRAGRREELLADFVEWLCAESSHSVLDVGAGPGRDGRPFVDAGLSYLGVDLAHGNALLAAELGLDVVQGSLFELPVRTRSVDAVWTMSTLLHVPDVRFDAAMAAIVSCVRPGGLVAVGLWGGTDREGVIETDHFDPPRFFSLRNHNRIRSMLAQHGRPELFETWDADPGPWDYQFAVLRV